MRDEGSVSGMTARRTGIKETRAKDCTPAERTGNRMLTLHYAPDNASLVIRLVLDAMGVPFRTRLVDRARRAQDDAEYRALNPVGRIPVLETPDGPIFETGAILLWLADRHGDMAPVPDSPQRGRFLSWLFCLSNTLHADMRLLFYPEHYAPPGAMSEHHRITAARLDAHLRLFEAAWQQGFAATATAAPPSVLDFYVACCLRWCALYPRGGTGWFCLARLPALRRLAETLDTHPATLRAIAAEGLGPTPFSAPQLACPPEGSAT